MEIFDEFRPRVGPIDHPRVGRRRSEQHRISDQQRRLGQQLKQRDKPKSPTRIRQWSGPSEKLQSREQISGVIRNTRNERASDPDYVNCNQRADDFVKKRGQKITKRAKTSASRQKRRLQRREFPASSRQSHYESVCDREHGRQRNHEQSLQHVHRARTARQHSVHISNTSEPRQESSNVL